MNNFQLYIILLVPILHSAISSRRNKQDHFHQGTIPFPATETPLYRSHHDQRNQNSKYSSWGNGQRKDSRIRKPSLLPRDKKANIILIITDDQDIELGSMNFMPKTLRILGEGGIHFPNAYVTTPMCCPSRSSMLTGMYVHNHNVYTNNDNCSSPMWQQEHEPRTFAAYLNNAGYRTAYFGKYLNDYNGSYIPPGWREWAGLIRNSRFYNYTINVNGNKIKHGSDYYHDYYPDLIANDSISFLRQSKQYFVNKPVMMVLSFPSPHGPEDAAPPYQHMFKNVTTHRTPNWNHAPNPDKQWILRNTGKMESIHIKFTDMLHMKRLQTLQSVDEAVDKLYKELRELGELDNTFIFYTSDHGYHLGQFGLVKGKSMPFEFDVRVPFYVRGPRVPAGVRIRDIVLNLDLAPTFLDIGGVDIPEHMDGKSVLPLIKDAYNSVVSGRVRGEVKHKKSWRDTFLLERGVITPAMRKTIMGNVLLSPVMSKLTKDERLSVECQNEEFSSPCKPNQKWECFHDGYRWRIRKCRVGYPVRGQNQNNCICPDTPNPLEEVETGGFVEAKERPHLELLIRHHKKLKMDPEERRLQRQFLKEHVNKDFKPVFIGSRARRNTEARAFDDFDVKGVMYLSHLLDMTVPAEENNFIDDLQWLPLTDNNTRQRKKEKTWIPNALQHSLTNMQQDSSSAEGCIILSNSSVICVDDVYHDPHLWRQKKDKIDNLIKRLRQKLDELKGIRRHLKKSRPLPYSSDLSKSRGDLSKKVNFQNKQCQCLPSSPPEPRKQLDLDWKQEKEEILKARQRKKEENLRKMERKQRRKSKFQNMTCNSERMNCFTHDNHHWKTAPLWTDGPFCFCQNSNNNTYWCLRTINETHNFLYCEFVTRFITYYDLKVDPYQLRNAIFDLDYTIIEQLHQQLNRLRKCRGARDCTVRYRPEVHYSRLRGRIPTSARDFRHWRRHQKWRPNKNYRHL